MSAASHKLERLEFTFMTRLSYWVILIGGFVLVADAVRIIFQTGELYLIRALAGVVAVSFTLLVWRGRARIVAGLIPEILASLARDEGLSEEEIEAFNSERLGRTFVIFGRSAMSRKVQEEMTLLAEKRGKPKIDRQVIDASEARSTDE